MSNCEKIDELLSGYLDDELTQGDFQRVDVHLRSCEKCRQTLEAMTQMQKAVATSQVAAELEPERWEKIMNDMPAKASRGIGWILFIAGITTLISLGIWEFAVDDDLPLHIKLAVGGVWFGLLFLFLSVLRQRILSYKSDKYKEVNI
jgi:predicted anti-sigma-YlaC factor YlaD